MSEALDMFASLIRQAFSDKLVLTASLSEMFDREAMIEFPFMSHGASYTSRGWESLARLLETTYSAISLSSIRMHLVRETADPTLFMFDFSADGRVFASGERFKLYHFSVVQIRNGVIVRFTGYWNPNSAEADGASSLPIEDATWMPIEFL